MPRTQPLVLLTLCFCAFVVNLDITLVNIALPRLAVDLHASTSQLQWIVDAYTLVFAALVLAAGSLSDRFGRRRALLTGLAIYAAGNALAALTASSEALIATRALMGVGAAVIFPTTLSILTNVYTRRKERAQAIGIWGAATGMAIAAGPIIGGAILEVSTWQATFIVKVPIALAAAVAVWRAVPDSRDPSAPRLDRLGLVLSTAAVGLITFTIIQGPDEGWLSARTLISGAASIALFAVFIGWERRAREPMLDLSLFANRRFSGASLAITAGFFAVGGFVFMITQYFQSVQGYGPLSNGLRVLPVAVSVAVSSIVGTELAVRRSNKAIVVSGLGLLVVAYIWVSANGADTSYLAIVGQMIFLGVGIGLTTAPATESIMGAVDRHKAGVGSAINDTARELGNTLGVAVIGSILASLYSAAITDRRTPGVPAALRETAAEGIARADAIGGQLSPDVAAQLHQVAVGGFLDGLQAGCLTIAGVMAVAAALVFWLLPSRPLEPLDLGEGVDELALEAPS